MISAAGDLGVSIDFGQDEPGMVLQRRYREGGMYIWNDYMVKGQRVLSPVDIEKLPAGKYRLV